MQAGSQKVSLPANLLSVDGAQLGALGVCTNACTKTGQIPFYHPTWKDSLLVTAYWKAESGPEYGVYMAVLDSKTKVRWRHEADWWLRLAPARPSTDQTGHLFLDYDPGRLNGVIILAPVEQGFESFDTLPAPNDYQQRFYGAHTTDENDDGIIDVESTLNDCEPSCALGSTNRKAFYWNGKDYVSK